MELSLIDALILVVVGFVAGFINVVAGGGSLISLPVLIFLGLPTTVANASNRLAIIAQNSTAVVGFQSKGINAFPYSISLAISAFFGAILGARISVNLDDALFNKIIAVVMVSVILITIFKPKAKEQQAEKLDKKSIIIGCITFFFIGIYGGFIQAGVGFLIIAALTTINGFSLVKTNSAKVFVALVYTFSAVGVFIYEDLINWEYGLVLAVGNASGGWVASRWSVKQGDKWIKRFLIVTVIGLAIKLWFF